MYRLDAFKLSDMAACGADIRQLGVESETVEESAGKIVRYVYDNFRAADGDRAFSLVRLFKTFRFNELDDELKRYACLQLGGNADMRFLTLLASAGDMPQWNDRRQSKNHRLIPVSGMALGTMSPMIAQLIAQLGVDVDLERAGESVDSYLMEQGQSTFNVFFVPDARECAVIYDREFVDQFNVRSVLGYGGMLQRSAFYAVIMFGRTLISKETAQMFNPLSLSTKNALIHAQDFSPTLARREPA